MKLLIQDTKELGYEIAAVLLAAFERVLSVGHGQDGNGHRHYGVRQAWVLPPVCVGFCILLGGSRGYLWSSLKLLGHFGGPFYYLFWAASASFWVTLGTSLGILDLLGYHGMS